MPEQQQSAGAINLFIARQPILRKNQKVFGYELLFRSGLKNFFDSTQPSEKATSKVITNTFLLIGAHNITGGKKAFINFSDDLLCKGYATLFPKDMTVVELLEDVEPTPAVLDACQSLADDGYTLALDDFLYRPSLEPLLKLAHIVKLDFRALDSEALAWHVEILTRHEVKLLAEKIETIEEFEAAKALGFHYFQGYFFSRPNVMVARDIPGSKLHYLQVIRRINDPNYNFDKLARLIANDVSLSYKLLKYVNSAYLYLPQKIRSLQGAVAMVGENNLRKWLNLMMLSYVADDKPPELVRMSIFRARFCELLAGRLSGGARESGTYYTVGMFSLLDAILDKPMNVILKELNLSEEINRALLGKRSGPLFGCLYLVRAYERGAWKTVAKVSAALGLGMDELPPLYSEALESIGSIDAMA